MSASSRVLNFWRTASPRMLPFADAASTELPLPRLLRLSMFQVSVGMALVLLNGTLNRVMIVELGLPASLVAIMVAIPIVFAPLRALIGFRSDNHRSSLGWRRVPYLWMGSLLQFGGLAIMPFALLLLAGRGVNQMPYVGEVSAVLSFLLTGAGLHMTQTAGVALATDLAPEASRPRVVALLYVMLLVGMVVASLTFGLFLRNFDEVRLIKVVQGAAMATLVINTFALWKQEARQPNRVAEVAEPFTRSLRDLLKKANATRLLVSVGIGGAAFSMQDVLLEPYGGEVLGLTVASTTALTALMAGGTLAGLVLASRRLSAGGDPALLAALGGVLGIVGFSAVIFSAPLGSPLLFRVGTAVIGFGSGWFSVGTLTASMALAREGKSGLAIGAWGAVQATVAGGGVAVGGLVRDVMSNLAVSGALGPGLTSSAVGYSFVYHLEIGLLFAALVAIGPLVRAQARAPIQFGLAELPG
jgi:MFS transporter, BCD family, chlorophyll transporter